MRSSITDLLIPATFRIRIKISSLASIKIAVHISPLISCDNPSGMTFMPAFCTIGILCVRMSVVAPDMP